MMYLQLWGLEQLPQETYQQECVEKEKMRVFIKQMEAVSYTHLTLPTIRLV